MSSDRGKSRKSTRQRTRDQGSAAVEFAILLPLFLVLVFGILDFGMLIYSQTVVNNAVREGARAASLGGTLDQSVAATTAAVGTLPGVTSAVSTTCTVPSPSGPLPCPKWVSGSTGVGAPTEATVKVTVNYTYAWLTPVPSFVPGLGSSKALSTSSSMVVE